MIGSPRATRRILVTGADGFLGRHVSAALGRAGYLVVAATRAERLYELEPGGPIHERCGTTKSQLSPAVAGSEAVVHLATIYGRRDESVERVLEANVLLPVRLAELAAARKVPLLLADTFYSKPGIDYDHLRLYTESKRSCFELCRYLLADRAPLIRMHIEHLYGPGDHPDKAIPSLVARIVRGEPVIKLTDATQRRDFIHVRDAAAAISRLVAVAPSWPAGPRGVGIGTGRATSLRRVLEIVKQLSGSESLLSFGALPTRPGEPAVSQADTAVLSEIGWYPEIDLEAGLRELVAESKVNV